MDKLRYMACFSCLVYGTCFAWRWVGDCDFRRNRLPDYRRGTRRAKYADGTHVVEILCITALCVFARCMAATNHKAPFNPPIVFILLKNATA